MKAGPFYNQESESRIVYKKDTIELSIWLEHLEYIGEELSYLIELEQRLVSDSPFCLQLQQLRRENALRSAQLYRYEVRLRKCLEGDEVYCDAYHVHNHERHRGVYIEFVREFRALKKRVLTKLIHKARP